MSPIKLTHAIDLIKKKISFKNYLPYLGYKKTKSENANVSNYILKENKKEIDNVTVTTVNSEERFFSIPIGDNGDIINFVINRLEHQYINEDFDPTKSIVVAAVKHLMVFAREFGENEMLTDKKSTIEDFRKMTDKAYTQLNKCSPLHNYDFFKDLLISKKTAEHEIFEGKIFNTGLLKYENKLYETFNVAFPITNASEKEFGLYYENHITEKKDSPPIKIQFWANHSHKHYFWTSNLISLTKIQHVTITSGPVEAIAHFQYYKTAVQYIGLFEVNNRTLLEIERVLSRAKSNLNLALNVSTEESLKEMEIISYFASYPMKMIESSNQEVQLLVSKRNPENDIRQFLTQLKKHNTKKTRTTIDLLGKSGMDYTRDSLVRVHQDSKNLIIFCPKNHIQLFNIASSLIKTLSFNLPIKVVKPKYRTWIDQNRHLQASIENENNPITKELEKRETFMVSSDDYMRMR